VWLGNQKGDEDPHWAVGPTKKKKKRKKKNVQYANTFQFQYDHQTDLRIKEARHTQTQV
jgi:hypothetical protein